MKRWISSLITRFFEYGRFCGNYYFRQFCYIGLLLAGTLCPLPDCVSAEQNVDGTRVFRAGFLQRGFSAVDPRDAKAALEVHAREISRLLELKTVAKVVMFADMASMANALRNNNLDLASIPTIEYLRIRESVSLIPSFVGIYKNGPGIRYVVITRKDNGIRSFPDLKGRSILLPPVATSEPCHLWLDVLLLKAGKGGRDTFFNQVRESAKISNSVMAVFLRQADAAIITRSGLDTNLDLNPQLGTQLIALAESPNLSDNVICMMPGTTEEFRNNLYKALLRLNESKSGQQVYTMLQSTGISPYKPEHIKELNDLLQEHKQLKAKNTKRK
jgi:ABC-type phosphate/phosphonate transport system substrate-binding protein